MEKHQWGVGDLIVIHQVRVYRGKHKSHVGDNRARLVVKTNCINLADLLYTFLLRCGFSQCEVSCQEQQSTNQIKEYIEKLIKLNTYSDKYTFYYEQKGKGMSFQQALEQEEGNLPMANVCWKL